MRSVAGAGANCIAGAELQPGKVDTCSVCVCQEGETGEIDTLNVLMVLSLEWSWGVFFLSSALAYRIVAIFSECFLPLLFGSL